MANQQTNQAWGSQIPLDPALQQSTPTTPSPYYQSYTHYPNYAPNAPHAQVQPPTPAVTGGGGGGGGTGRQANTDVDALKDALGSAGVDLRAEEESLHRSHDQPMTSFRNYEDRTRKQPDKPSFDTRFLGQTIRSVAPSHKVTKVPEDTVNYLALALRARLQDLITAMIAASEHRTDSQFDKPASLYPDGTPMWSLVVRSDVAKQLAAIEKVERDEEQRVRRERKEREDALVAHAAQVAAQASGSNGGGGGGGGGGAAVTEYDEDGMPKKKKKKEGPGVTAKNMSEDVRKKISNATASHAAGISTNKYSWMTAGAGSGPPKVKPPAAGASSPAPGASTPGAGAKSGAGGSWARPYVSSTMPAPTTTELEDTRRAVTMRDALFVIEKERGHGGGRGSARGWV